MHKKLAVAFDGRSCDFCHEDFKRLYDWERHMRKAHKSSPPIVEGLTPSHLSPPNSSTPQPIGLQLQQRNTNINLALSDRRSSQRQAPLLPDNRFQHCSNRASPYQHCRSGVGHRDPWVETSAYTGYTKVLQTGDLNQRRNPTHTPVEQIHHCGPGKGRQFQSTFSSTLPETVWCADFHARYPWRHFRCLQHHCTGRR